MNNVIQKLRFELTHNIYYVIMKMNAVISPRSAVRRPVIVGQGDCRRILTKSKTEVYGVMFLEELHSLKL